jgi:hypothetical protein
MAFTVTNHGSQSSAYASSRTVSAFTPPGDTLLVALIHRANTSDPTSITGHGTWTQHAKVSGSRTLWVYILKTASSPSSSTVSVSFSTSTETELIVLSADGADVSTSASASIRNTDTGSVYNGSGGPFTNTASLPAFGSATNMSFIAGSAVFGGDNLTAEAGYTEIQGTYISGFYKASSDTSPSFGSGANFVSMAYIAMEIIEATGGGGPILPIFTNHYRMMKQR